MRSPDECLPVLVVLLSVATASCAGPANHTSRADAATTGHAAPAAPGAGRAERGGQRDPAQAPPSRKPPRDDATDAEVLEAVGAVERAEAYGDLMDAVERYEEVIGSSRTVALVDRALQTAEPGSQQRGLLVLERQLSLDCRQHGAKPAARLLAVRLVAASALGADSAEQFAAQLEKFAPLAKEIDGILVRNALAAPADTWPPALLPLMEQLARDWPADGALPAARRLAQAAGAGKPGSADTNQTRSLAGHWRSTEIVFDSPRDEHLVLHADGAAETWIVTASGREPPVRGRWTAQATTLSVDWADGRQWSQPFTFHEGQLVFPNVAGRRQFWARIE